MWWTFYHGSPWFERTYVLDPYETIIDRRPVSNRMTVGDEIESGKGNLLLSTYKHYGGTAYRAGDLYAGILLDCVNRMRKDHPAETAAALEQLGIDVEEDPSTWHWDHYWRLFCVIEGALPRDVLTKQLDTIVETANRVVWSDRAHTFVHYRDDFIEVDAAPDQTIFPTDARKTCAYSPATGYQLPLLRQLDDPAHADRPAPGLGVGELGNQRRERVSRAAVRLHHLVGLRPLR